MKGILGKFSSISSVAWWLDLSPSELPEGSLLKTAYYKIASLRSLSNPYVGAVLMSRSPIRSKDPYVQEELYKYKLVERALSMIDFG